MINTDTVRRLGGRMYLPHTFVVSNIKTYAYEVNVDIFLEQDSGYKSYLEKQTRIELGMAIVEFIENHSDKDLIFKIDKTDSIDRFTGQKTFHTAVNIFELEREGAK